MDSQVVRLSEAAQALVAIETPQDAIGVIRYAEAARVYARQAHLGAEAENAATAIRLKAEVRLAETVTAGQEAGEIARRGTPPPPGGPATLDELGVNFRRLSEARTIAGAFTLPAIDGLAEEANEKGRTLSRASLLREARLQGEEVFAERVLTDEDRSAAAYRDARDAIGKALDPATKWASTWTPDQRRQLGSLLTLVRRAVGGAVITEVLGNERTG